MFATLTPSYRKQRYVVFRKIPRTLRFFFAGALHLGSAQRRFHIFIHNYNFQKVIQTPFEIPNKQSPLLFTQKVNKRITKSKMKVVSLCTRIQQSQHFLWISYGSATRHIPTDSEPARYVGKVQDISRRRSQPHLHLQRLCRNRKNNADQKFHCGSPAAQLNPHPDGLHRTCR